MAATRDQRRLLDRLRVDLQTTNRAALVLAGGDLGTRGPSEFGSRGRSRACGGSPMLSLVQEGKPVSAQVWVGSARSGTAGGARCG